MLIGKSGFTIKMEEVAERNYGKKRIKYPATERRREFPRGYLI